MLQEGRLSRAIDVEFSDSVENLVMRIVFLFSQDDELHHVTNYHYPRPPRPDYTVLPDGTAFKIYGLDVKLTGSETIYTLLRQGRNYPHMHISINMCCGCSPIVNFPREYDHDCCWLPLGFPTKSSFLREHSLTELKVLESIEEDRIDAENARYEALSDLAYGSDLSFESDEEPDEDRDSS